MMIRTAALVSVAIAIVAAACGGGGLESAVSEELSTAGGSVILDDGASIYIPPGALSEAASVTIARASDENPPPEGLEAADSLGEPFRIEIEGQDDLASPVTVEVPYDPESLPDGGESTIFLAYFDDEANEWIPVSGVVDTERNVIAVQTSHLSWWQVWTWNWGAWIAVLNNLLTLNLTDWFDAVTLLTSECSQGGETVTVDASKANNVIQGCVERDDASAPGLRVINPKSFFYEVRSTSHEGNMFPQRILGPGESVSFEAPVEPPMVYSAEINQRSGLYLIAHLVIQLLPGLNQLGIQGSQIACITERIADVAYFAAAVESLIVQHDGAAAAEDLTNFLLDDAAVLRFITASDDCFYGAAATWSPEGIRQIGAATATIMSATDFVANYFLNYHSEVAFTWAQPTPTPTPTATVPPPRVEPVSDSREQQASNRAMQFCREDLLTDGFQEIGDGVLDGLVVSIFGGDSTTFQVRDMFVDAIASEPLSPADRANGIEWKGAVGIQWISRYRLQLGAGDWTEWKNAFAVYEMQLTRGSWSGSEVSGGAGFLTAEYEGCTRVLDYNPYYELN